MPSFWDTLLTSGAQLATKVAAPLGGGLSQGIANLVQTGQNKVSALAGTIVQTTDPSKPRASQPAAPPTTTPITAPTTQLGLGIALAGLLILYFILRGKK